VGELTKPYPPNWHRKLDFMPPMQLQVVAGAGGLELYYCHARVTVKETTISRMPGEARTEYGTIRVNPAFRNVVDYEMGNPNPRNGIVPVPQREILDDVVDGIGGAVRIVGKMPDVVIKSRGAVEKIPKAIEGLPAFEGAENVFYHQNAYANLIHKVRRSLNIWSVENPYRFMKSDLLRYRIVRSSHDPVLKKLRSTLKTEYVITDTSGWSDLGDANILALEQARLRWWTDIGKPTPFQIPVDHTGVQGQIYRLLRRNCLVVV
jgi:hypothetical protein